MHTQPPDPELQKQVWTIFRRYESCIDVEIQQRAVEYFEMSKKGAALMDILSEMPRYPERQSALIKKAEETGSDTAEQSAIKMRTQQQTSNALVVTDQPPVNGTVSVTQLSLVKLPNMSNTDHRPTDQQLIHTNGMLTVVDPQPPDSSADLLGDLLGPLAIEGPPATAMMSPHEGVPSEDALALSSVGEQPNSVQTMIGIKAEWRAQQGRLVLFLGNKNTAPLVSVQALTLPPSHLKMELSLVPEIIPPRAQVQCPLEVINLRPSRDVAVLDFSYKFSTHVVDVKLRLPAVLNFEILD